MTKTEERKKKSSLSLKSPPKQQQQQQPQPKGINGEDDRKLPPPSASAVAGAVNNPRRKRRQLKGVAATILRRPKRQREEKELVTASNTLLPSSNKRRRLNNEESRSTSSSSSAAAATVAVAVAPKPQTQPPIVTSSSSSDDDEAFARKLQEQFYLEDRNNNVNSTGSNHALSAAAAAKAATYDDDEVQVIGTSLLKPSSLSLASTNEDGDGEDRKPRAKTMGSSSSYQERLDEIEARKLQAKLDKEDADAAERARSKSLEDMQGSVTGKALLFVQEILDLVEEMKKKSGNGTSGSRITAVAKDDMVYLAEEMLTLQGKFRQAGKPINVDLGIHYTQSKNLDNIRSDGLLTKADRDKRNIKSHYNGSAYGDGVYTANTLREGLCYGDTGLIVARLQGIVSKERTKKRHDTLIANGGSFVVLRKSSQCLALVQYPSALVKSKGAPAVTKCKAAIQKVVDKYFNTVLKRPPSAALVMGASVVTKCKAAVQKVVDKYFNGTLKTPSPPSKATAKTTKATTKTPASAVAAGVGNAVASRTRQRTSLKVPPVAVATTTTTTTVAPKRKRNPKRKALKPPPAAAASAAAKRKRTPKRKALKPPPAAAAAAGASKRKPKRNALKPPPAAAAATIGGGSLSTAVPHRETECIQYKAPNSLSGGAGGEAALFSTKKAGQELGPCSICLNDMKSNNDVASMVVCGHQFHPSCIREHFHHCGKKCPICRKVAGQPQGKMPSGTMTITYSSSVTCKGNGKGAIVINYSIPGGKQKSYHDNPGVRHHNTYRTAYIPNNNQGQKLLKRLKCAFKWGLTFTVGTSQTTNTPNSVTWSSIHHKTSPTGGPQAHGFPDPGFFINCNEELDNAGVPSADDIGPL